MRDFAAIILAAGKGIRMRSALPKVLHRIAHRPMLEHVLAALAPLAPKRRIVVVGPDMPSVAAAAPGAEIVVQREQRGTGDAVACAREALKDFSGDVLILLGDAPLVTSATLTRLLQARRKEHAITVLGMRLPEPGDYGRLVARTDGSLDAIVEAGDCNDAQRRIDLCNSGVMAVDGSVLFELLDSVGTSNSKHERYLTDIVAIAKSRRLGAGFIEAPGSELLGVNSRADLAKAEAAMQHRLRQQMMEAGVTLIAPETVFFSADTKIGRDSVVGPFTVFGPGCSVGEAVEIPAHCHMIGATIGDRASIGPFARLRPGADLGDEVHIGNFVEVKNARLEDGVKANHLTYLGDSHVGAKSNIGAGTITCNYDGIEKRETTIGEGVFIGSNTALVAPVTIGDGAYIGAGSTITKDVPADAIAIARGGQVVKERRASAYRKLRQAEKAMKEKK